MDEFLIKNPLKAVKDVLSLDAFEGAAKVIFGGGSTPASAPAGGGGASNNIRMQNQINQSVRFIGDVVYRRFNLRNSQNPCF